MPDGYAPPPGGRFSDGDNISATCELCGAGTSVPLMGVYHPDVVDQATSEVTEWLQAHFDAFHPEHAAAAADGLDTAEADRKGPAASGDPE